MKKVFISSKHKKMSREKRELLTFSFLADNYQVYNKQKTVYVKGVTSTEITGLSENIPTGANINISLVCGGDAELRILSSLLVDREMKYTVFQNETIKKRVVNDTEYFCFRVVDCFV